MKMRGIKRKDRVRWRTGHIWQKTFSDTDTKQAKRIKIYVFWSEDSLILANPQLQQKAMPHTQVCGYRKYRRSQVSCEAKG